MKETNFFFFGGLSMVKNNVMEYLTSVENIFKSNVEKMLGGKTIC